MKQNIQQLIIAATIILAAGNNCAVAQSNSTAISSSETISTSSPSPRLSLRSNLLLWAFGSPSLGMDLTLGRRWQVGLDGSYGNWSLSHRTHAARLSTAGLQLRRYFRPFTNRNSAYHPNLFLPRRLPRHRPALYPLQRAATHRRHPGTRGRLHINRNPPWILLRT